MLRQRIHGIGELAQGGEARIWNLPARKLRQPRMTDASFSRYARPLSPSPFQALAEFGVEIGAHAASIAKFCDTRKQHFATSSPETAAMHAKTPSKPAAQILADALNFFMPPYWSNLSLSKVAEVSEGTIRNYRKDAAVTGTSGKNRSAQIAELERIANAMGLQIADLLQDLSNEQRAELYRKRAAEHYQRTGSLPPWAPTSAPEDPQSPPFGEPGKHRRLAA